MTIKSLVLASLLLSSSQIFAQGGRCISAGEAKQILRSDIPGLYEKISAKYDFPACEEGETEDCLNPVVLAKRANAVRWNLKKQTYQTNALVTFGCYQGETCWLIASVNCSGDIGLEIIGEN